MAKPQQQYQADRPLGHAAESDGIEEFDNKLPTWWLWLFYFTIAWGVWVILDWHVITPKTQLDIFAENQAIALETYGALEPVEVVINDATIAAGEQVFVERCVACHAEGGTGNIGPDLTDDEWILGGTVDEISHTVFYGGRDGLGMLAWGPVIGSEDVAVVTAYVTTLGGAIMDDSGSATTADDTNAP